MYIDLDFGTTNSGAAVLHGQHVHVLLPDPWSFGPGTKGPASHDPTVIRSTHPLPVRVVHRRRDAPQREHAYSFMGYQGFPPDTIAWRETYGPKVAEKFKAEEVDCVLLTPA